MLLQSNCIQIQGATTRQHVRMADEHLDPVARARAIAARLAATAIPSDALGKRKSRWEVRLLLSLSLARSLSRLCAIHTAPWIEWWRDASTRARACGCTSTHPSSLCINVPRSLLCVSLSRVLASAIVRSSRMTVRPCASDPYTRALLIRSCLEASSGFPSLSPYASPYAIAIFVSLSDDPVDGGVRPAPGGFAEKKRKKVYIPVDKYPDINFMGASLCCTQSLMRCLFVAVLVQS